MSSKGAFQTQDFSGTTHCFENRGKQTQYLSFLCRLLMESDGHMEHIWSSEGTIRVGWIYYGMSQYLFHQSLFWYLFYLIFSSLLRGLRWAVYYIVALATPCTINIMFQTKYFEFSIVKLSKYNHDLNMSFVKYQSLKGEANPAVSLNFT